ncbi:MAG: hypothetical protein AB7N65_07345 [Vicinamibacterales bacterium]
MGFIAKYRLALTVATATLLAVAGLLAVVSHCTALRTHLIGIRVRGDN